MPACEDDFKGDYRKGPKTSIVRTASGQIAPPKKFADLTALLASFVHDDVMRKKYPKLLVSASASPGKKRAAPNARVPEERRNVQVDCWVHDVRSEADGDFHVIVGSTQQANQGVFLNVEVAGLPTGGKDRDALRSVCRQLTQLVKSPVSKTKYLHLSPARKVRITGSLFFDGDHLPGKIGPGKEKPQTVWEIHPVTSIRAL